MIPFFKKTEIAIDQFNFENDINFRSEISNYFVENFSYSNFFLTKSCTQSLEIAFKVLNFSKGMEVILPSYGFVSLANSIMINGLKCVFVDCEKETMNIDINAALSAITEKTVAILTINYGGVSCDYDVLRSVCKEKNIVLVEDNAHGFRSKYKLEWLGSIGDISTISFDFLKNISCDEGGGISILNDALISKFEILYHFGTDKARFLRGEVEAYEWKGIGTNVKLAEPLAEILYHQVFQSESIINEFLKKWNFYYNALYILKEKELIDLVEIPQYSTPNGHMFWLKTKNEVERAQLINFLKSYHIESAFHYTPLHLSEYGKKYGIFRGIDKNTTSESKKLLRIPHYYNMSESMQLEVIDRIFQFYQKYK